MCYLHVCTVCHATGMARTKVRDVIGAADWVILSECTLTVEVARSVEGDAGNHGGLII